MAFQQVGIGVTTENEIEGNDIETIWTNMRYRENLDSMQMKIPRVHREIL